MALTKQKLQAIRVDLQAALDTVAKKHGLARLVAGNCTFEKTGAFTWKLEGIEEGGLAKEQRVPPREIDQAVERMRKFEADPKRHTFRPGQS